MSTDRATPAALLLAALLLAPAAAAQGFAAMVTPPRFELEAKPGQTQRHVIEIMNADNQPATYHMRTADWTLDDHDVVQLTDALAADSCRPWVAIERREVTVGSGARYRYRFEVTPPANASGECRFAIVLTGGADAVNAGQNIKIPINGQIAVIVYVTLDGAKPALEVVGSSVIERDGRKVPVIRVRNDGNAHTRLEGFLKGVDPGGKRVEFTPSGLPILPGQTRDIALDVAAEGETRPTIPYPLVISGTLEWSGKSTPFEARFAP
jgi:P pilus assembly chaperone PapD